MIKLTIEFNSIGETQEFLNKHYAGELPTVKVDSDTDADGQPNPPPAEETPAPEKGKKRRRGRPAKKEEDAEPTTGRRRAARPATTPAEHAADPGSDAAPPSDAEISDAEVSKAASEAAKELSVQKVLDELAKFEVAKVSELSQPQRREFVGILRDLLNPSEGAADPAFN